MRLTKDIKNQILANILRGHEIATEAKTIMMDSRDLAYAITLDCMPEGIRTFAALREHIKAIRDDQSQMYGVSVYTNKATYSYNTARRVSAAFTTPPLKSTQAAMFAPCP